LSERTGLGSRVAAFRRAGAALFEGGVVAKARDGR